ncbi:UbiA prenyltransferase family [Hypoxylon fuscum]|nr:UbiA prenyltransferase family [Hypoxylon fuscum]
MRNTSNLHPLLYRMYSIWLFTRSDLKTIVLPQSAFGLFGAMTLSGEGWPNNWPQALIRSIRVVIFVWINLLPFAIDNQRRPVAIVEDAQNKPWRTMPSGRMTEAQARTLMLCLYPIALLVSLCMGGIRQSVALIVLGYSYNSIGLADLNWVSRNGINAAGFCCFASGALEVAIGQPLSAKHGVLLQWLAMIAGIVFSTVQTQDMADQAGDAMRGRKSLPLTVGDTRARWFTAVAVMMWSVICPLYWKVHIGPVLAIGGLGGGIALRTLVLRDVEADRKTFRLWNAWMGCIYLLPLLA